MPALSFEQIPVFHVSVEIHTPFDGFTQELERLAGRFDAEKARAANAADLRPTLEKMQGEQGLMIFGKQDHGALFALEGATRKAFRYHIGNPLFAFSMTRHDIRAALYAPLTVLVYEVDSQSIKVEFDQPSSLFGQFSHPEITDVGQQLDAKLRRLIEKAADLPSQSLDASA